MPRRRRLLRHVHRPQRRLRAHTRSVSITSLDAAEVRPQVAAPPLDAGLRTPPLLGLLLPERRVVAAFRLRPRFHFHEVFVLLLFIDVTQFTSFRIRTRTSARAQLAVSVSASATCFVPPSHLARQAPQEGVPDRAPAHAFDVVFSVPLLQYFFGRCAFFFLLGVRVVLVFGSD